MTETLVSDPTQGRAVDSRNFVRTLLKCGVAVGVSDFLFASISNGLMQHRTPVRVFQGVASVPFGKGALDGGLPTAALGLGLHFCVALFWSAVICSSPAAHRGCDGSYKLRRAPPYSRLFTARSSGS